MQVRFNLPVDLEEVATQIAQHDDKDVVRFIKTILEAAARLELDELLIAHVWRGILREYESGNDDDQPLSIQELLDEYPD